MADAVEKVTAFITRQAQNECDLLLFEHPYAGIQIPAGTVETGETPEAAVIREAFEETGLSEFAVCQYLGCTDEVLTQGQKLVSESTRVYARPDTSSVSWANLRKGITVALDRHISGFSQVTYEEFDQVSNPQYVTYRITGWVPDCVLAGARKRYFFHLEYSGSPVDRRTVDTDYHRFTLFWAPVKALPDLVRPQDTWIEMLHAHSSFATSE